MVITVPHKVELREERYWAPDRFSSRDVDPVGEWLPYVPKSDPFLDALVASAAGNAKAILMGWLKSRFTDSAKRRGLHLIPGQIQKALGLPVRQVYLFDGAIYRVEKDGTLVKEPLIS